MLWGAAWHSAKGAELGRWWWGWRLFGSSEGQLIRNAAGNSLFGLVRVELFRVFLNGSTPVDCMCKYACLAAWVCGRSLPDAQHLGPCQLLFMTAQMKHYTARQVPGGKAERPAQRLGVLVLLAALLQSASPSQWLTLSRRYTHNEVTCACRTPSAPTQRTRG